MKYETLKAENVSLSRDLALLRLLLLKNFALSLL